MTGYRKFFIFSIVFIVFLMCAVNIGYIYKDNTKITTITTMADKLVKTQEIKAFEETTEVVQKLSTTSTLLSTDAYNLIVKEEVVELSPVEKKSLSINVDNLLFVGNSLVDGLRIGSNGQNSFICKSGIDLKGLKNKGYLDNLCNYSCETVVIEMGTNELGWYNEETFKNSYIYLIEKIREVNINSNIICLSIPPVSANKSASSSSFNNTNVQIYNQYIKDITELSNTIYLDCTPFFGDVLSKSMTSDGIHLKGKQYGNWYNFVIDSLMQM